MRSVLASVAAVSALFASSRAHAAEADPWLGQDKALHFGVSALISSNAYLATRLGDGNRALAFGIGAGTAIAVGTVKELYDLSGRGDPSWKDFTWDVIGTGTGLLAAWAVDRLVGGHTSTPHALRIGDWNVAFSVRVLR